MCGIQLSPKIPLFLVNELTNGLTWLRYQKACVKLSNLLSAKHRKKVDYLKIHILAGLQVPEGISILSTVSWLILVLIISFRIWAEQRLENEFFWLKCRTLCWCIWPLWHWNSPIETKIWTLEWCGQWKQHFRYRVFWICRGCKIDWGS